MVSRKINSILNTLRYHIYYERDMSEDWEQDIIEWVGDRKVKQLNKLSWGKFGLSILAALGSLGGGWWKMEDRVSKLEEQMAQKQNISNIELEIARLKRDKELLDLKWSMKDSLRLEMARYKDLEKNWKKKTKGMRNETSLGKVSADS